MTTWGEKSYSLKQKMNCFLCDSKDSFFWFCLFVYFCKNCKDLVYIIERGKNPKRRYICFSNILLILCFCCIHNVGWSGWALPVVREENKKACQAELTKLSPLNSWLSFFLVLYLPFAAFWNEVVLTSRSEPSSVNFLGSVLMEEKS